MPSTRQLQRYKNSMPQEAGLNDQAFHWMFEEAKAQKLPSSGYVGGLIFDEMSLQVSCLTSAYNTLTYICA